MRSFCTGALAVSIPLALHGCGSSSGGGPSPTPPGPPGPTPAPRPKTTTPTPENRRCAENQGQCDQCLDGECLSCNDGYGIDKTIVPGGTCVASCSLGAAVTPAKPSNPEGFSGQAWPEMCLASKNSAHFFGIGDWGGDGPGQTWTNPGVPQKHYPPGPLPGPDDLGMHYVARQMKDHASSVDPDFVLNAGDNFYPGGYPVHCGSGADGYPNQAETDDPHQTFANTFRATYSGPGMDGKPWLGVLGNHDYGGRSMTSAWDQQIFHTWHSDMWRTPAPFWSQRVQYQDFAVQLIFLDSNFYDAGVRPDNNICQEQTAIAETGYCWGVTSDSDCRNWFAKQWSEGIQMAENILKESTAEWHILISHYPTVFANPDIIRLRDNYGVDMVFTGHDHRQRLTQDETGMVTIRSGGGGGVTTDNGAVDLAGGNDDALGFVDFEISRTSLTINMHTWGGCTTCDGTEGPAPQVIRNGGDWPGTLTISPHGSAEAPGAPSGPTPAPGPSAGDACCWGASAGTCEGYLGQGGLCNGDWTTTCVADGDCNTEVQIV